jgi:hypothetical protein
MYARNAFSHLQKPIVKIIGARVRNYKSTVDESEICSLVERIIRYFFTGNTRSISALLRHYEISDNLAIYNFPYIDKMLVDVDNLVFNWMPMQSFETIKLGTFTFLNEFEKHCRRAYIQIYILTKSETVEENIVSIVDELFNLTRDEFEEFSRECLRKYMKKEDDPRMFDDLEENFFSEANLLIIENILPNVTVRQRVLDVQGFVNRLYTVGAEYPSSSDLLKFKFSDCWKQICTNIPQQEVQIRSSKL